MSIAQRPTTRGLVVEVRVCLTVAMSTDGAAENEAIEAIGCLAHG